MNTELELSGGDSALAEKQLITLDPAAYTAAVYKPFQDRLALLKVEAPAVVYDVTTTAGMELAKKWRATCKAVRIDADKERETRKAPILKIGKLLESAYKEIETAVEPLEGRFDASIKAQEAIKEQERQAKIAAEQKRLSDIQDRITELRSAAGGRVVNAPSALILEYIADLEKIPVDDTFAEFRQQAEDAKSGALAALKDAHAQRVEQEAEQARIKAERAELARLREEQAARDAADRARLAQEEADAKVRRDAEEAQARAQRAADDAKAAEARKAEQDRLDALSAELGRQRERLAEAQAHQDRALAAIEAQAAKDREPAPLPAPEPQPAPALSQEPPAPAPYQRPASAPDRPTADEIVTILAEYYGRDRSEVIGWLMDLAF